MVFAFDDGDGFFQRPVWNPFSTSPRHAFIHEPFRNSRTSRLRCPRNELIRCASLTWILILTFRDAIGQSAVIRLSANVILPEAVVYPHALCFVMLAALLPANIREKAGVVKLVEESFDGATVEGIRCEPPKIDFHPSGGRQTDHQGDNQPLTPSLKLTSVQRGLPHYRATIFSQSHPAA